MTATSYLRGVTVAERCAALQAAVGVGRRRTVDVDAAAREVLPFLPSPERWRRVDELRALADRAAWLVAHRINPGIFSVRRPGESPEAHRRREVAAAQYQLAVGVEAAVVADERLALLAGGGRS